MPTSFPVAKAVSCSSVAVLLDAARHGSTEDLGRLLQVYRNYLTILASSQLDRRLRRRMNASDLVQEAMLNAHRDFDKFQGRSVGEFFAWMRQILINCLHHAVEANVKTKARDIRCEVSLDDARVALDRSFANFARFLADRGPSPSAPVQQREDVLALANLIGGLRSEYREVIVLRSLQGLSFDEVAEQMGRRSGTVRMLWLRAMDKLRANRLAAQLTEESAS